MKSLGSNIVIQRDVVFKYKDLRGYFIWLIFVTGPLFAFFITTAIRQESIGLGIFSFAFMLFFLFGGYAISVSLADVIISGNGISRRIGNRALHTIRWDDIKVIKTFDSFDYQTRKRKIGLNILPREKPRHSLTLSGKIVLGDHAMRLGRFTDLVDLLNKYIAKHHVKIESTVGGRKTYPERLDVVSSRSPGK